MISSAESNNFFTVKFDRIDKYWRLKSVSLKSLQLVLLEAVLRWVAHSCMYWSLSFWAIARLNHLGLETL